MGSQEEEFYCNLSRKELQELSKKHGLPANKTNSHLANLLASYYQKKNVNPAPSIERPSGPMEILPHTSLMSDLNSVGGSHEDIIGVHKRGVETANVNSCGPFCTKDVDKGRPLNVNGKELVSLLEAQISHMVSGATANGAPGNTSSKEIAKGFGCLNCEIQENKVSSPLCSQCGNSLLKFQQKEPLNSNEAIDTVQKLPGPIRDIGLEITPQSQCRNKDNSKFPVEKGFVSFNETCTDVPPFQFYVRSEEGINLFVDLNSSPSDWIKSLKNEVCIYPELQKSKSWALQHELRNLGDTDEQIKTSLLGNTVVDFQSKSESDHVGVDHSDGDGSFSTFALKSISTPLEMSGYPDRNNQLVSQLCKPNSHIKNTMDVNNEWSPKRGERINIGREAHDTSQFKSTGYSVVNFKSNRSKEHDLTEPQLKSGSMYLENTETGSIGTSSVSQQIGLPPSHEVGDAILQSTGIAESSSGVCLGCSTSCSMVMQLSEAASHCEDTSNFPDLNVGQPNPDNTVGKLQTGNGGSSICGLDQNNCGDPTSACPEEQGGKNAVNETESSECSQIDDFLVRKSKRSLSSEDDGLQRKRQHGDPEDHINRTKPVTKNIRSGKDPAREGFPRRSMRLVSK